MRSCYFRTGEGNLPEKFEGALSRAITKRDEYAPEGPNSDKADIAMTTIRVGLVADPGLPAKVGTRLAKELPRVLRRHLAEVRWEVEEVGDPLVLDEHGTIPMLDIAERNKAKYGWDVVVLITDLPRRAGTRPIMSDLSTTHGVALLSLPALGGGFRLRRRLRDVLVHLIGQLAEDRIGPRRKTHRHSPFGRLIGRLGDRLAPTRHVKAAEDDIDAHLALTGVRGRFRLLRGMVHDNRPWRLVPHMASATAAAAATAAFGIFYSSIWNMADALPSWRLALINVVAIAAMVVWLVVHNHLWDRPSGHARPGQAVLYNLSTMLTLIIGVTCMYAMLYVLALLAAAAVIDAGYLKSELGHPVGIGDYATLVWMSCSMGIVAGALGSSLDSEQAVREATYSRRERERQARNREQADEAQH